jgi:hypothetical protein
MRVIGTGFCRTGSLFALSYTLLPAIIACHRNHSHFFAIWVIDLLFTPLFLVGWIAALVWAFIDPKRRS